MQYEIYLAFIHINRLINASLFLIRGMGAVFDSIKYLIDINTLSKNIIFISTEYKVIVT